jgi:hypothetical protein
MKKIAVFVAAGMAICSFYSCQKDSSIKSSSTTVSEETLSKIKALGFGISDVRVHEDGYLVEGDIILTNEVLNRQVNGNILKVANAEQYRTTNLVKGTPRVISVALDSKLAAHAGYPEALQEMVNRYNALKLTLTYKVVSSGATITYVNGNGSYLASAGFPTSSGEPYGQVKVNARAIGSGTSTTFINYLATILAHEGGHCIGFRHTDYMDRSFSCGGAPTNEGASTVGAILIPGTPSGPDAKSWMLSCIGSGVNRPFNSNDKTALNYLY